VPPLVGRGDLDDGHVDANGAGLEEPGDPREAARDQIDPACRDGFACHPAGVERLEAVFPRVPLVDGDRVAEAHELDQLEVLQVSPVRGHEVLDEGPRFGHPRAEEDGHAGLDLLQHLIGLDDPVFPEGRVFGAVEQLGVPPLDTANIMKPGAPRVNHGKLGSCEFTKLGKAGSKPQAVAKLLCISCLADSISGRICKRVITSRAPVLSLSKGREAW